MPPTALAALRRVVPCLEKVHRIAFSDDDVIEGNQVQGNVGKDGSWWPSKQAMLSTRKQRCTNAETAQLEAEVEQTTQAVCATGEVDESIHAERGLAEDADPARPDRDAQGARRQGSKGQAEVRR